MKEIFKTIADFPNYEISNKGKVRNKKTEKMLKNILQGDGYYTVNLYNNGKTTLKIHRLVAFAFLEKSKNKNRRFVDHIDTNRLNNRVDNLRFATVSENGINRNKNKNNKSKYKGVSNSHRKKKPWVTHVCHQYKKIHIGHFATEEEAGHAYDKKAKELFGEYAKLNFPE